MRSRIEGVAPMKEEKPLREKRCETCACWNPPDRANRSTGDCAAQYPVVVPVPSMAGQIGAVALWPPTEPYQWCRKWEPKEQ